jgi:hypothetical protein
VQQLLQSSSNVYVNPAYEVLCTQAEQEAMQAAGLMQNCRQGNHKASLHVFLYKKMDTAAPLLNVICIMLML